MTFEGGKTFPFPNRQAAVEATGIVKKTITSNINRKNQSLGKKGMLFEPSLKTNLCPTIFFRGHKESISVRIILFIFAFSKLLP
jgi:hypothetical protein